jgi:transcriptional regulator with XRE-family HTH domain
MPIVSNDPLCHAHFMKNRDYAGKNIVGMRIRQARARIGMTQAQLGERLKLSTRTIVRIENGESGMDVERVDKLASLLETSTLYLLGEVDDPVPKTSSSQQNSYVFTEDWIKVPVFSSITAACGGDGWGHEQIESEIKRFVFLPSKWIGKVSQTERNRPFIVPAEGDSMEDAHIPDGFLALVNPEELVRSGDPALVRYGRDKDVAIKWVYWGPDGSVEIRSATLRYPPKRFTREDVENDLFYCGGKVMKVLGTPKRGA